MCIRNSTRSMNTAKKKALNGWIQGFKGYKLKPKSVFENVRGLYPYSSYSTKRIPLNISNEVDSGRVTPYANGSLTDQGIYCSKTRSGAYGFPWHAPLKSLDSVPNYAEYVVVKTWGHVDDLLAADDYNLVFSKLYINETDYAELLRLLHPNMEMHDA